LHIFEPYRRKLQPVRKVPHTFSYRFEDDEGTEHAMMIADWEIGALHWQCMENNRGDDAAACVDVRHKYMDDFARTKDLYFFLGTTHQHHLRAENPFIIVGTFHPKRVKQTELNLYRRTNGNQHNERINRHCWFLLTSREIPALNWIRARAGFSW
jgi:hypothetical protein